MPEGPEVWALSLMLNEYNLKSVSYGKHLFYNNQDWTFGLHGRVFLDPLNQLIKVESDISGTVKDCDSIEWLVNNKNLGKDWMNSKKEEIQMIVNEWKSMKKKLGTLLIDQSYISGIGVAWGSEILHRCQLDPNKRAFEQNLNRLTDVIIEVRDEIKFKYTHFVMKQSSMKEAINNWYYNLYALRTITPMINGIQVKMGGRVWWSNLKQKL